MSDEIEEFLTARFDEDDLTARDPVEHLIDGGDHGMDFSAMPEWARHHVLHWTPDRVIREVEAKRQILALHPHTTQREEHTETEFRHSYGPHWEKRLKHLDEFYCERCHIEDGVIEGDGGRPCETLRLLALPYVDHPDFCEEWRP